MTCIQNIQNTSNLPVRKWVNKNSSKGFLTLSLPLSGHTKWIAAPSVAIWKMEIKAMKCGWTRNRTAKINKTASLPSCHGSNLSISCWRLGLQLDDANLGGSGNFIYMGIAGGSGSLWVCPWTQTYPSLLSGHLSALWLWNEQPLPHVPPGCAASPRPH